LSTLLTVFDHPYKFNDILTGVYVSGFIKLISSLCKPIQVSKPSRCFVTTTLASTGTHNHKVKLLTADVTAIFLHASQQYQDRRMSTRCLSNQKWYSCTCLGCATF